MSEATTILIDSPDEVKLNKYQYMPALDDAAFADLKEDVAENGILQAVLLDGDYWVIDGHHRIKAWKELREQGEGPDAIAARVFTDMDEDRARDLSISVNTLTRQFTAIDKDKIARDIFISKAKHFAGIYGDSPEEATNYGPRRVARMVRRNAIAVDLLLEELIYREEVQRPRYYYTKHHNHHTGELIEGRQRVPGIPEPTYSYEQVYEGGVNYNSPHPPPRPSISINDEEIPLEEFNPNTTIREISTGRIPLPSYPKKTEEEKAYDELIKIRRRLRTLSPAQVAAVQQNRAQAQSDVGGFTVTLRWMKEFTEDLRKHAKSRLRLAK